MKKVIFISLLDPQYSRSGVYLGATNHEGLESYFEKAPSGYTNQIQFFRNLAKSYENKDTTILIMSPSHYLVIIAKLVTGFRIILDAGWSLTEASLTRKLKGWRKFQILKNYFIDSLSMHFASITLLESDAQIRYCRKLFLIPRKRLLKLFTGFNEVQYAESLQIKDQDSAKLLIDLQPDSHMVLFRGKYNEEAGLELIIEVAKICQGNNIQFVIATNKYPKHLSHPSNMIIIEKYLSEIELVQLYRRANCCLGQISKNRRLSRTIPHKAFEAGFFAKPYITVDNSGIREFLPGDSDALYLGKLEPHFIAGELHELLGNHELMKLLSRNIHHRYSLTASQLTLRKALDNIILK
jgi:hypothetical protein